MKYYSIIFIGFLLSSCSQENQTQENTVDNQPSEMIFISKEDISDREIQFTKVTKRLFSEWVNVRGRIDVPPASRASVSSYFGGFVEKIDVLPGQEVKKGEALFILRNPAFIEIQQEYLESIQTLNFLAIDFKRQQQLFDQNVISERDFNKSQSDYLVAKANHQASLQQLKMAYIDPKEVDKGNIVSKVVIHAPISGNISQVWVNLGSFLHQEDVALEIINTDHIHLDLTAFEQDATRIKEGQRIRYSVPEAGIETGEGIVYLVGKTVTGEDRFIDVHGHLQEPHQTMIHGLFVEADIEVAKDSLMVLPKEAVVQVGDEFLAAALRHEDNLGYKIELIKISVGKKNEDLVEVIDVKNLSSVQVIDNLKNIQMFWVK